MKSNIQKFALIAILSLATASTFAQEAPAVKKTTNTKPATSATLKPTTTPVKVASAPAKPAPAKATVVTAKPAPAKATAKPAATPAKTTPATK